MKLQYKELPGKVVSWDDATLTITHFISTETQDSGGDVMIAKGMQLRGKPVVLFQHGQDPVFGNEPIAKALKIEAGENEGKVGILATTQYFDDRKLTVPSSVGERLYMKAKDDTMPNWSIGFNSLKSTPIKGGRRVDEWELHEYSQVAVGMNKEATTLAMKKYGDLLTEPKFVIVQAPEGFADMEDFYTKTKEHAADVEGFDKFRTQDDVVFGHNTTTHQWEKLEGKGGPGSGPGPGHGKEPHSEMQEALGKTGLSKEHAIDLAPELHDLAEKQIEEMWADGRSSIDKDTVSQETADILHNHGDAVWQAAGYTTSPDEPTDADQDKYGAALDKLTTSVGKVVSGQIRQGLADTRAAAHAARHKKSLDIKSKKAPHELAHKNINALHKEMVDDLKAFSKDDVTERGTEGCAKEALEDFADSATPHVEKYIKCVREMEKGAELPSMEEKALEGEEKSYTKSHKALHAARNEMIKSIHALTGDKSVVPSEAAKIIINDHHKAAMPHAKEFIKAWHKTPETNPVVPETKPPVLKLKPQAQKKVLKLKPTTKPKVTAEMVQQLIAKSNAQTVELVTAELRRLSGKVTK